ncbi:hypothetical protein AB4M04_01485 [Serratia quinivorans]|jgi:hypothetical protein|uniref:Uncharacterized protein n=1 Tax=Serratia quinivorans TaxID=137545 RepID=A0ABV3UCT0_9GAMM
MTNCELLKHLVKDGGSYTCSELRTHLNAVFPGENIDVNRTRTLRAAMVNSCFVKCEWAHVGKGEKSIKVVSVDPRFGDYARAKPKGVQQKITDSYLRSEPPEVVRHILLVQQFNKLLAPVTHQRAY